MYAALTALAVLSAAPQAYLALSGDPTAAVTASIIAAFAVVSLVATRFSARGDQRTAALLLVGAVLGMAVLVTANHKDPGLAVTLPIIGFVLALPYVRGRSLVAMAGVVLAAIVVVVRASALAREGSPAVSLVVDVVFGGMTGAIVLMVLTWRIVRSRERLAERMTSFVEGVPVGIFRSDAEGRLIEVNEAIVRLLGCTDRTHLIGTLARDLAVRPSTVERATAILTDSGVQIGETEIRRIDGSTVWVRYHVRPEVDADGRITGFEGAVEDVSADRMARDATARLAAWKQERAEILDALRRLAPGRTVEETADAICAEISSGGELTYAALLELHNGRGATIVAARSGGRRLNAGSPVAQKFATELRRRALDGPWVEDVIARRDEPGYRRLASTGLRELALVPIEISGDVVGLLLAGSAREALDLRERLPTLGEFATHASALIGPVLKARHSREDMRDRIRDTIERGAFAPVFQPIVDIESAAVLGYEALTRFDDGTPPDRMFADAASCGMNIELETATIEAALKASEPLPANLFIDLNVGPDFVLAEEPLRTLLRERGFNIVLEITEHVPIADYPALRAAFASLGDNVQVAVDDAGAGYASLRHITELRPQFVKLDRGLISGIDGDLIRQALITGMVHFADGVGSMLIAEGVETPAERATLQALGVRAAQGYLFARPQPANLVPR